MSPLASMRNPELREVGVHRRTTLFCHGASACEEASALAGDAIAGDSYVDFVIPDSTTPADSVWYNTARLVGTGSGPGIIVFYTFQTLLEGDANIACLFADLRDSQNNRTLPECHGGVIHILGPVPARAASWGHLKQIYR